MNQVIRRNRIQQLTHNLENLKEPGYLKIYKEEIDYLEGKTRDIDETEIFREMLLFTIPTEEPGRSYTISVAMSQYFRYDSSLFYKESKPDEWFSPRLCMWYSALHKLEIYYEVRNMEGMINLDPVNASIYEEEIEAIKDENPGKITVFDKLLGLSKKWFALGAHDEFEFDLFTLNKLSQHFENKFNIKEDKFREIKRYHTFKSIQLNAWGSVIDQLDRLKKIIL